MGILIAVEEGKRRGLKEEVVGARRGREISGRKRPAGWIPKDDVGGRRENSPRGNNWKRKKHAKRRW